METQAELMSLSEAAKYLNLSSNSLRAMVAQGGGPPSILLGPKNGVRRFKRSHLDAWLDARATGGKKTQGKLTHIKAAK